MTKVPPVGESQDANIVRDLSISPRRSALYSLPAALALILPVLALYLRLHHWQGNWPAGTFLGYVAAVLVSLPIHELLHGLGWRMWGGAARSEIRFGLAAWVAYCVCDLPVPVTAYRRLVLLPGVVLSVPACLAALASGSEVLLLFGVTQLGAASGDAVILWRTRHLPADVLVRDHGSRVGCVVVDRRRP